VDNSKFFPHCGKKQFEGEPSYKKRLLKSLTDAKCMEILQETKKLQQWIKEKL
jgi:hypothetical protein